MNKTNLELFKEALREGLSNRIDSTVDSYNGEIIYSDKHDIAMRTILQGKLPAKKRSSTKLKRVIAVIAILALLLVSCGIVYRDEIRELKEKIHAFYDELTYSDTNEDVIYIDEIYELTYIPEGYQLEDTYVSSMTVVYQYRNADGKEISFNQDPINNSHYYIDNENGENAIIEIHNYSIYYRKSSEAEVYLWNDGKYIMLICTEEPLSIDELRLIIEGIKIK